MADGPAGQSEHRVLVLAPTRRDGELAREVLAAGGVAAVCCADLASLAEELRAGCGAALLTDTVLDDAPGLARLLAARGAGA